jgi:Spy/CpxP family protein refolding chaperone
LELRIVENLHLGKIPILKNMLKPSFRNLLAIAPLFAIYSGCLLLTGCPSSKVDTTTTTTTTSPSPEASASPSTSTPSPSASTPATPVTQDGGRPERAGSNPLQVLQTAAVKAELKLTDDQVAQIKQVESDLNAKVTSASKVIKEKYQAVAKLPKDKQDAEKKKLATEIETGLAALTTESKAKMSKILKPDQQKRANEILLQKYDFGIITKDDFATELKLTDAQKKQLNDIVGQMREKTIAAWEIPDKDDAGKRDTTFADNRKRMEAVMKESNTQAKAVLTPEQVKILDTLKGKAFDVSQIGEPSK